MSQTSSLGAFVLVGGIITTGLLAVNEALDSTDPAAGSSDQFETVEGLLSGGFELLPLALMLLAALAVLAAIRGGL